MSKPAKQTIQQWGNSLAVRIPSAIARSAHLKLGQAVEISVDQSGILIKPVYEEKYTLAQKLSIFDPEMLGGEVRPTKPIGAELIEN